MKPTRRYRTWVVSALVTIASGVPSSGVTMMPAFLHLCGGRHIATRSTGRSISRLVSRDQYVTGLYWSSNRNRRVRYRQHPPSPPVIFMSTKSDAETPITDRRVQKLHQQLSNLGINADDLESAAMLSITTTEGFDQQYGKSAIKAYRTYVNPSPSKLSAVQSEDVAVAAARCARQIDFLAKRHRSHEAEWVRHHDANEIVGEDKQEGPSVKVSERDIFPLYVVLDNVRSAFNVGSIFRTADACACAEVITTGITPHPRGSGAEKLAKSALGAEVVVPSRHFTTTIEAIHYFRKAHPNVVLVGMETTALSTCYTEVVYPGKASDRVDSASVAMEAGTAIFLGNEVTGVDTEVIPLLDMVVEIPMFGKKNSLNIAACAPVVMYEILRQWGALESRSEPET